MNPVSHAITQPRPRLSVAVPCYNEADNLGELHQRVGAVCHEVVGSDHEIVLVNDGSKDATWTAMLHLAAADPNVVLVDLSRNHGHQLALTAGLALCAGERVFIVDGDLQDPPELLPQMMAAMDQGADVVYGQRIEREGETWFKKASAALFYRLMARLTDVDIPLDTGDFRLINRRVCDALLAMPERHRFIRGMVSWIGFRQVALPYRRAARAAGTTKYTLSRMINFAADAITGFSIRPLRVAIYMGGVTIALAGLLLLWVLYQYFVGDTVPGWSSLMATVLFLSAIQMIFLGVIGEYVGRSFMETKGRPLFIIRSVVRGGREEQTEPLPEVGTPVVALPSSSRRTR